jgi:hypothetical protein
MFLKEEKIRLVCIMLYISEKVYNKLSLLNCVLNYLIKVKVKLSLCLTKYHTMKTYFLLS